VTRVGVTLALVGAASIALLTSPAVGADRGVPRCRTAQLRLGTGAHGEAALQFMQTLTFTNESSESCRLSGWPSVQARGRLGEPMAVKTVRVVQGKATARPYRRVLLRPRGAASFDVYGADYDAVANRPCGTVSGLVVTPPGDRAALRVAVRLPNCGVYYVAPLIAGRRDRDAWSVVWKR
jgi:Protein of unknown function (DUF4232)